MVILSAWLTIIKSINVSALSDILVGSFMTHFNPYVFNIRKRRLPRCVSIPSLLLSDRSELKSPIITMLFRVDQILSSQTLNKS